MSDVSAGWRAEYDAQGVPQPDGGDGEDDRRAERRARYLDRTTALRRREALALAYRELGYTRSGIARRIDATPGTVREYLATVTARYGPTATMTKTEAERGDLDPVGGDDVDAWPSHYREWWVEAVDRQPDAAPDDVDPEEVYSSDV